MADEIKPPSNLEIEQALREFEANPNFKTVSQKPKQEKPKEPFMVRLVMKLSGGSITDRRQAEYVLLGFVVVAIFTSIWLFSRFFASPEVPNLPTPFQVESDSYELKE